MSTQHIATLLDETCWACLATVLRHVGCCWLKFDHLQTWANNTQHVATWRNIVAKCTQHVMPNNVAICCVDMLWSFGWGLMWQPVNEHISRKFNSPPPAPRSTTVYDICRLQTADRRPQTADCRLQTGSTRKILLTVTSSSTTFPTTQNNINLVEKILLDFLWWFTVMVLDFR